MPVFIQRSIERRVKILFVQRKVDQPRWISNLDDLYEVSRRDARMANTSIRMQILEELSLLEQFAVVARTDILLGAHGAGLAWLVAMPRWSVVIEVMPSALPKTFACVEGWDSSR